MKSQGQKILVHLKIYCSDCGPALSRHSELLFCGDGGEVIFRPTNLEIRQLCNLQGAADLSCIFPNYPASLQVFSVLCVCLVPLPVLSDYPSRVKSNLPSVFPQLSASSCCILPCLPAVYLLLSARVCLQSTCFLSALLACCRPASICPCLPSVYLFLNCPCLHDVYPRKSAPV
jgi:hypothetical protein